MPINGADIFQTFDTCLAFVQGEKSEKLVVKEILFIHFDFFFFLEILLNNLVNEVKKWNVKLVLKIIYIYIFRISWFRWSDLFFEREKI